LTPRVRRGQGDEATGTVQRIPIRIATSGGQPVCAYSRPAIRAPIPPSANWPSEICPANPLTTTIDRIITPEVNDT
jgi:hypothetical protein